MPEGWQPQTLQLPAEFRKLFRDEAERWGQSSVKLLGTLAVGAIMGLPEETRKEFYFWVLRVQHDPEQELTSRAVFEKMLDLLSIEGFIPAAEQPEPEEGDNIKELPPIRGWEVARSRQAPVSLLDPALWDQQARRKQER